MSAATLAERPQEVPTDDERARRRPPGRLVVPVWFVMRNGVLPWAMLIVAGVNASVLAMRGAPWRADLLWIIDWIPIGHVAVAPVVAGAAAIDLARLSVGTRHLEDHRWWRSPAAAVTWAYAVGVGGTNVAAIVVAALVEVPPSVDPRALLGVGVHLLMLTLFAALGALVGRALGPILGGVLAAVIALVGVSMFSARTEHISLLYAGASLNPRVGRSYSVVYLGSQVVMLSLLILACLMMRRGVARSGWRRVGEGAVAVVAVGLVVVAGSVGPSSRLVYTGKPPSLCEDVSGVPVCMYPEHARVQAEVNTQLARMFEAARQAGYHSLVPREVREVTGGEIEWHGASLLLDEPLIGEPVTPRSLVLDLVDPWYCDERGGEVPTSDAFSAESYNVESTWLELVDPALVAEQAPYRSLDSDEVDRLMREFRTCTYPFR
ncbi:hypothetical protein ACT17Q_13040 [Cellulomonas sp. CW35]|uniref:hypothetical protein n=1 Tax=Cellulomonas sp. CW35 TaxID=3458249 RepID=UPI004034D6D7